MKRFVPFADLNVRVGRARRLYVAPLQAGTSAAFNGKVACCRFHGHRVKMFLLKPESMNAKTNIQPRV